RCGSRLGGRVFGPPPLIIGGSDRRIGARRQHGRMPDKLIRTDQRGVLRATEIRQPTKKIVPAFLTGRGCIEAVHNLKHLAVQRLPPFQYDSESIQDDNFILKSNEYMATIHGMNFNALDLNLMRVFDALLKERSVTAAGQRIGLSQP